jgi:hypothetical protein
VIALTLIKSVTLRFTLVAVPGKAVLFSRDAVCPNDVIEIAVIKAMKIITFLIIGPAIN